MSHLHLHGVGASARVRPVERRTEQLNVRLRPSEDDQLRQEAARRGYHKRSEFARDLLVDALARSAP